MRTESPVLLSEEVRIPSWKAKRKNPQGGVPWNLTSDNLHRCVSLDIDVRCFPH
jgi:hypothetical protein